MKELSVLDYIKNKFKFWQKDRPEIPSLAEIFSHDHKEAECLTTETTQALDIDQTDIEIKSVFNFNELPWRALLGLLLALIAQQVMEPPGRSLQMGVVFYLMAGFWLLWAFLRGEFHAETSETILSTGGTHTVRQRDLVIGLALVLASFAFFGKNLFTSFNLLLWGLSLIFLLRAFWLTTKEDIPWWRRTISFLRQRNWQINISRWTLIVAGVVLISIFFRFYRLDGVPSEMFSDHAEKLIDVGNVLGGEHNIYFVRNTGREAFQMYLTAAMATIFKTGLSFMSLKLGTVLAGLATLPFIYLLGKEVGNRRVALFAMLFAGIAYWPNVISRVALRFALYPLFAAPTLFYLFRGLRTRKRNDFILSGIALGLGLHGYSPARFIPLLVVILVAVYLLHKQARGYRWATILRLGVLALFSLLVFVPLLRFALSNMDLFSYRMLTRMGTVERAYPGPPVGIFLKNLWNAVTMFSNSNGIIWVHSVPLRPALDVVSGALFHLGSAFVFLRYLRQRRWQDISLLLAIPLLMMPSILSLAFPNENPSLNRTSAAIIPVFIVVGIALDGLLQGIRSRMKTRWASGLAWSLGLILIFWSSMNNYDLVFNQYAQNFSNSAWNTSELGAVIQDFSETVGTTESAYVVPFMHWVDTRLVGYRAGQPGKDYALWPVDFPTTISNPNAKLFLVKPDDVDALTALQDLYENGSVKRYNSPFEGKDFLMFFVPPLDQSTALETQ